MAAGGARKRVLPQPKHEHGAERDRAHGHERCDGHAARQIVAAARRRGAEGALGQLGSHAIGDRLSAKARVRKILQPGEKMGNHGLARDVVLVEHEIGLDQATDKIEPLAERSRGRGFAARGEARIGDERTHEQPETQALVIGDVERRARQIRFSAEDDRLGFIRAVHQRP